MDSIRRRDIADLLDELVVEGKPYAARHTRAALSKLFAWWGRPPGVEFVARSAFFFSSILVPSLRGQAHRARRRKASARSRFPAALLARLVIVPYRPLDDADLRAIARLKLARIQERFALTQHAELTYDEAVLAAIVRRARESESGARTIDAILTHTLLPGLSGHVLARLADGIGSDAVHVHLDTHGEFAFEVR